MESRKMALKNLVTGQQWRNRHREQIYGHGRGEKRMRCMERVTGKLTLPCVKYIAKGNLLYGSGNSEALYPSRGVRWGRRWKGGLKGRGYMYTYG